MSFRLKTVLGVALIEAVLLVILIWSSLDHVQDTGELQLQQRAETTAKLFATTTANAVLSYDLAALEAFVGEVMQNPGLAYARVFDTDQVLAEQGAPGILERGYREDRSLADVDDGIFDHHAEIIIEGTSFGRVEIGLHIGQLQDQIQQARQTFSGIAVVELVLSALFSLVLGGLLTRQLGHLIEGTRAVRKGQFGHQVPARGRDEIAQAASAFNRMSSELAELMRENAEQQEALRENAVALSGLIDNLHAGVLMVDAQGMVQHVNRGLLELFRIDDTPEALIGRPFSEIANHICHLSTGSDQDQACTLTLLSSGASFSDRISELSDGRVIESDYVPLVDGENLYGHIWNHRDVSEREHSRRLIEERKRQLDTVFELSPDGFIYLDRQRRVSSVNQAFTRITGLTGEQVLGLNRGRFFATLREHCAITDIDDSSGKRIIHTSLPQPRVLAIEERALRVEGEQGGAQVMYLRDVTHETELDRMKSDFLASTANELSTPLANVHGTADRLLAEPAVPEQLREGLGIILSQSESLARILDGLLDLARIEARAGKEFEIRMQPLLPALQDICNAYVPPDRQRKLSLDLPDTLPLAAFDPNKLAQVINNLLENAFRFSPEGGAVWLRATENQGTIGIRISDQGIGMNDQQCARAFDRFYRADRTGNNPGAGLGLSLVREIADIHGWRIEIDSKPAKGTSLILNIPVAGRL